MAEGILISPISAWEIRLLSRPGARRGSELRFLPDPKTWFARVRAGPAIKEAPLTPAIAIGASYLPAEPGGDPDDPLIVATARHLGIPIVTRDRRIVAYAGDGHVRVIPCRHREQPGMVYRYPLLVAATCGQPPRSLAFPRTVGKTLLRRRRDGKRGAEPFTGAARRPQPHHRGGIMMQFVMQPGIVYRYPLWGVAALLIGLARRLPR